MTLVRILFPLNILTMIGWNKQDFAYTLLLTRSRLELFCINMCTFTKELWPLTPVRISYQLNILRMNEVNLMQRY